MENTTNQFSAAKIDTATEALYNENDVRQIAAEAAQQAVTDLLNRLMSGPATLENSIPQTKSCPNDNRLTLTVQEVADQLGISKPTALKLVNDGSIHAIRIGRKIIVPRQAVTDYLYN